MWQRLAYLPLILALLGSIYGGLRITSNLQTTLEKNTQMSIDAHERISGIEQSIDMTIENIKFSLEAMNEKLNYKFEDAQRELIQLNKTISIIESTTQTLEKNSFNNATMIQFQGLQDLIYQQKEALMELKNTTGPMDMTPMFYELQNRIMELERRVDDLHKNWN
jgi:cell division protein FtsX